MRRLAATAVLLLALLTGCTTAPPDPTPSPTASASAIESPRPVTTTAQPSAAAVEPDPSESSAAAIDTSGWPMHRSGRYGLRIGHPPDWTIAPSERQWMLEDDGGDFTSVAQERFMAPVGDVWVTAWSTPYSGESLSDLLQWIRDYCVATSSSDCSTIAHRAVPLCFAHRGCHPGLLVTYAHDVQACFSGGEHEQRLVCLAIWRSPDYPVPALGTARQVLDAFLSTMDVRPQP